MKLRNRNQKWSDKDVYILSRLMREHVPHATIAAVLGRSEASLRHAIKNTLYQQLLHHMPADILTYYRMQEDTLYEDVVNPVYFPKNSDASDTASDEEEESRSEWTTDAENEEGVSAQSQKTRIEHSACDYIVTTILSFVVASGIAVYIHMVKQNWT